MYDISELIKTGIEDGKDKNKLLEILATSIDDEDSKIKTFEKLYDIIYGEHLCDKFCCHLVEYMHHDGESGKKWTLDQTNEIARKLGIQFGNSYTQYEFWAVCHMIYYDYHKSLEESGQTDLLLFGKMADDYLDDEDSPKGKLVNYFFFIENNSEK